MVVLEKAVVEALGGIRKVGSSLPSGFLAGLNADSSVNVILVPQFLSVKLKPAYMPFDAVALSQEVLLQRSLQFLKTTSG